MRIGPRGETLNRVSSAINTATQSSTPDVWVPSAESSKQTPAADSHSSRMTPQISIPPSSVLSSERTEQHAATFWRGKVFAREPTWVYRCSDTDVLPHCFPDGAFRTTPSGMHVNGIDELYIELPAMGSNALPEVTVIRNKKNRPLLVPRIWGLSESSGYVVEQDNDNELRLHTTCHDATSSFTVKLPEPAICVASSRNTLATGHTDGVRLWSLPDLRLISHMKSEPINRMCMSRDGGQIIVEDEAFPQCTSMWNTKTMKRIGRFRANDFCFDDCRNEAILFLRFEGFQYLDWIARFTLDGSLKFQMALDTAFKNAFVPSLNLFLTISNDQSIALVSPDKNRKRMILSGPNPFGQELIGDIATSRDGRWAAILLERGDVLLWDLTATDVATDELLCRQLLPSLQPERGCD